MVSLLTGLAVSYFVSLVLIYWCYDIENEVIATVKNTLVYCQSLIVSYVVCYGIVFVLTEIFI